MPKGVGRETTTCVQLMLLARLHTLNDWDYARSIARSCKLRANVVSVSLKSMYKRGFLDSYIEDIDQIVAGRRARVFYRINDKGNKWFLENYNRVVNLYMGVEL